MFVAKVGFSRLGHVNLVREIGLVHFYGKNGWPFFARRPIRMLPFFFNFLFQKIFFSQWNAISDAFFFRKDCS
jgi:hypothetical protein